MEYSIRRVIVPPPLNRAWSDPAWGVAETITLDSFHPKSSGHRPKTEARVVYDEDGLYVAFHVADRYVRACATQSQASVCFDSCVEFFVQPRPGAGYFNFELNCIGTILAHYVDTSKPAKKEENHSAVTPELLREVRIESSLRGPIETEITTPLEWTIAWFIPRKIFEHYVGPLGSFAGQTWRANFFKCADATSHPHWGSWSSIGEEFRFHQPARFAPIRFMP